MSWADALSDLDERVMESFETEGTYTPVNSQGFSIRVDINSKQVTLKDDSGATMFGEDITADLYKSEVEEPNHGDLITVAGQNYRVVAEMDRTPTKYTVQLVKLAHG